MLQYYGVPASPSRPREGPKKVSCGLRSDPTKPFQQFDCRAKFAQWRNLKFSIKEKQEVTEKKAKKFIDIKNLDFQMELSKSGTTFRKKDVSETIENVIQ